MQRTTRPTANQSSRTTSTQAKRTVSGQSRAASPQVNRTTVSQVKGAGSQSNNTGNIKTVICRKCKSSQIVANKRGYSFTKMFSTLGIMILIGILSIVLVGVDFAHGIFGSSSKLIGAIGGIGVFIASLSLPVSILVGFVGRSTLINGCMNCGFKWTPAKRK